MSPARDLHQWPPGGIMSVLYNTKYSASKLCATLQEAGIWKKDSLRCSVDHDSEGRLACVLFLDRLRPRAGAVTSNAMLPPDQSEKLSRQERIPTHFRQR